MKEKAALEAQVSMLQTQTTSNLTDLHGAVTALHALLPPLPPLVALAPMAFDREWCAAVSGTTGQADIDATSGTRAHIVRAGLGSLKLRSVAPLPRRPSPLRVAGGRQQDQLPAYRIVVETYGRSTLQMCLLGFMPSYYVGAAAGGAPIASVTQQDWCIMVFPSSSGTVGDDGWTAMETSDGAYATTSEVPPVPPGSAVEFAVDYAAGTCRVAFYTPEAMAGGFVEPPHAKMELRFVPTTYPPRSIPTLADSDVELYPAAASTIAGVKWRFAS
jgi:hypothetical protein